MSNDHLRRRTAREAARLMYGQRTPKYRPAKLRAARQVLRGQPKPGDLPTNREIRRQVESLARSEELRRAAERLRQMRLAALEMMRLLRAFCPRLIGGVLSGQVRENSRVGLQLFADDLGPLLERLDGEAIAYEPPRKRPGKHGPQTDALHIRLEDRFRFDLAVYPAAMVDYVFRSAATGRPIERAGIAELEELIRQEHPEVPIEPAPPATTLPPDPFRVYQTLLGPLETVIGPRDQHPEGDALYHSLQVFELARQQRPYDEELLLAALLHDVGKAIDPIDHEAAALEVLAGTITPRTAWLIEHHSEALALRSNTLGARARRRLEASEDFEDLLLLAECDAAGRQVGMAVPEVPEALEYLRQLAAACGE